MLSHWLAQRRDRKTARRNAAIAFQFAIFNALKGLYPLPEKWPKDIDRPLRDAFAALQMAVAHFRPFVAMAVGFADVAATLTDSGVLIGTRCSTARNTFRPTHPAAGHGRGAQAAVPASLGHRSPHHDAALAQDGGNARRAAVELAVEGRLRPAALAQHLADRNATGGSQGPGGKTTP